MGSGRKAVRRFRALLLTVLAAAPAFRAAPLCVRAQDMPPHLIQTVTDKDIYEGMLALGYLITPVTERSDCAAAYENVKNCIVRVQMGDAHGSGIVWEISEDGIVIATNRHVLDYWQDQTGFVHFPQGYDVDAALLGVSGQYDVGFLKVDAGQFEYRELQTLCYARTDEDVFRRLVRGEPVFLPDIGGPGEDGRWYEGTLEEPRMFIEDFNADMVYCHAKAVRGMSGSGIFDARGYLIAMTTGGTEQNEAAGIPLPDLMAAYAEVEEETERGTGGRN